MDAVIKSGSYDVVCSGVAFTFEGEPLSIEIQDAQSGQRAFLIRFLFIYDTEHTNYAFQMLPLPDEHCTEIRLYNYEATAGSGVVNPIRIATNSAGSVLWLVFIVAAWNGRMGKKIEYTVFRSQEAR